MNNESEKIKNRFIKYLNNKEFNLLNLLYLNMFHPLTYTKYIQQLYDKIQTHLIHKQITNEIDSINNLNLMNTFIKCFKTKKELKDYIIKYFNKFEQNIIILSYHKLNLSKIYIDLIFILNNEFKINKVKKLYYTDKNKLIGYDNIDDKNNYLSISTNKYLTFKINNKQVYLILNYNIEDYILNWCSIIDDKHDSTYNALRLYSINNELFNDINNNCKKLSEQDFFKKYLSTNIQLNNSIYEIFYCNQKNINIKLEFDNLINYINKNKKQYDILYRGEQRYNKVEYKKNQILYYNNIHSFSKQEQFSIKFMKQIYHKQNDYLLFILKNGFAAEIHPIRNIDEISIYDYYEYLHKPAKYKIIDIKIVKKRFYYKSLQKYRIINYQIIYLQEI